MYYFFVLINNLAAMNKEYIFIESILLPIVDLPTWSMQVIDVLSVSWNPPNVHTFNKDALVFIDLYMN
jgi:hypothetical protein